VSILDTFFILFDTDAKKATREMADLRGEGERTAHTIDHSVKGAKDLAPALDKAAGNAGKLGQSFRNVATLIVSAGVALGALAVTGLKDGANRYNEFTNSLRVAGLAGESLTLVQDRLTKSALANGSSLTALGQLYSRVTSASTELGVSQAEVLDVTDAVSAAVRVQGGDAAAASGAMLQLAQALGAGTVRAEEFNSINEGLLPLLQAAARASDKYGGSVAKLRADVMKGTVSSREFFDLIRAGTRDLEGRAGQAVMTDGQRREKWNTVLARSAGALDRLTGYTRLWNAANETAMGIVSRFAGFIERNSRFVEGLGVAMAITAGVVLATYVPAMWAAATATIAATWPIIAIVAAITAVGVAFALAYDDVKAFLTGQPSLIGVLLGKYKWLRDGVHAIAEAFRGVLDVASGVFSGLAAFARGWWAVMGPILGLLRDVAIAVFGQLWQTFQERMRPFIPLARFVFGVMSAGIWAVGVVFKAVFGAIGQWWSQLFDRIVKGVQTAVGIARQMLNLPAGQTPAMRALGAGQRQLSGASASPLAAQTSTSLSTRTSRNTQVNMGGVTVNAKGADPNAVGRALNGTWGETAYQFDDGVAR